MHTSCAGVWKLWVQVGEVWCVSRRCDTSLQGWSTGCWRIRAECRFPGRGCGPLVASRVKLGLSCMCRCRSWRHNWYSWLGISRDCPSISYELSGGGLGGALHSITPEKWVGTSSGMFGVQICHGRIRYQKNYFEHSGKQDCTASPCSQMNDH